jgi:hypothetical protein
MRQSTNKRRKVPEGTIANLAKMSVPASPEPSAPPSIPLDLKPLIAPYREHRRLSLRIENLPQSARLSAGQNNGDRTWSLALDELEGLFYIPPTGFDKEHALAIRLISKDETGASTVALLDFRIGPDRQNEAPQSPPGLPDGNEPIARPPDQAGREEISALKATLAERDAELDRLRASAEQMHSHWQQELAQSLLKAESAWKSDEAARLQALQAALAEQFAQKLADVKRRAQADADASSKWEAGVLRRALQELAAAKDTLAERDAERTRLEDQLDKLRQQSGVEIAAVKMAADARSAETLRHAQAQWQQAAAKQLAEATARCEAAEAALASAQATLTPRETERIQLQDQLERLRRQSQADISAAQEAAERMAAERLKAAEAAWQEQAAKPLAEVMARCQAAEAALASARAAQTPGEAERAQLEDQLERLRRQSQADVFAAQEAAERMASDRLKAAEAAWQERTAKLLAEVTARCEAAETSARAPDREAEHIQFQDQLERLRRKSEADISAAKEAAALMAADRLKAAEAAWQERSARSLAEVSARCQAAEAALASAQVADKSDGDAYIRSLNLEVRSLQKSLVDREADLVRAQLQLDQMRPGLPPESPAMRWQPLSNRVAPPSEKKADHLVRDVFVVVAVVIAGILALPQIGNLLPDDLRWQITTLGGLFDTSDQESAAPAPPLPPPAPPKPALPAATVARPVNMRAQPATDAAVLTSLKRGAPVAILEKSGNWDRVEASGEAGQVLQGWVYGSYLSDAASPAPKP